ncbi:MAG TPA: aldo/keto reductase [Gemmatimonadaceae bacterium]|nr:aldo/keto reductase [Gemmatimonadaceae bacterium]
MSGDRSMSRRDAVKLGLGAGAALTLGGSSALALEGFAVSYQAARLIERAIPSTGEKLPVVGIGTAINYQTASTPEEIAPLKEVLKQFPTLGGKLIDSAPSYGNAEVVVGTALAELKTRDKYFVATKVSVRGGGDRAAAAAQMEASMRRLQTDHIDLMQIWNVSNPELLAPLLDEWKTAKRIRYTGITSSSKGQYPQLEATMRAHKYDFVQIDLAIDNRSSQERILPLAAERGMGVLINLPFGRTSVFKKVAGKPVPDWAKDIDATSFAQIFLKYIVSNPAVTAVIPGTATIPFLADNMAAAHGRLPDAAMRKRIEAWFDAL